MGGKSSNFLYFQAYVSEVKYQSRYIHFKVLQSITHLELCCTLTIKYVLYSDS